MLFFVGSQTDKDYKLILPQEHKQLVLKIKEFDSVFKEKFICSTSKAAMILQAYLSCTADLK